MKLAVDIHREGGHACVAAVAFDAWESPEPKRIFLSRMAEREKPVRGELDLRDLPCILQLLREHALEPELIVIDGFVHLDTDETPGPGWHLHHALAGRVAVVGVSKSTTSGLPVQFEVTREDETRPLVVTCIGIDLGAAKARLRAMHGRKRVPTLLKLAARQSKAGTDGASREPA